MVAWLPENIASYGSLIDGVMQNIFYIVGAWLVLAELILFGFVLCYRRRPQRRAAYIAGDNLRSMAWVLVPTLFVLGFDLAIDHHQAPVWKAIKQDLPPADYQVKVKARQFVWEFFYPGQDGQWKTADDIQTVNQLYVPLDKVVQVELESEDVLHSLWIPNLRFKQDVVPGRAIRGWFKAIKAGEYKLGCAEICGVGHGNMGGWVHVMNGQDYQAWIKQNTNPQ